MQGMQEKRPFCAFIMHAPGTNILNLNLITYQEMLLFRKLRLWGCYKPRHVTKQDILLLATIRYPLKVVKFSNILNEK